MDTPGLVARTACGRAEISTSRDDFARGRATAFLDSRSWVPALQPRSPQRGVQYATAVIPHDLRL